MLTSKTHAVQPTSDPSIEPDRQVHQGRRQRLLGGLAALMAGVLAARSASLASAADGELLKIGNTASTGPQSASSPTELDRSNVGVTDDALRVTNDNGNGVTGTSSAGNGLVGFSAGGNGVFGYSDTAPAVLGASTIDVGVSGVSTANNGSGVVGESNTGSLAAGVFGRSTGGAGVRGEGLIGVRGTSATMNGIAVGANCTGFNGSGMFGRADNGPNANGVQGVSTSGVGVIGDGAQTGVTGTASSNTGVGVSGKATGPNGTGVRGEALGNGVFGTSTGSGSVAGVRGLSSFSGGNGVIGQADTGANAYGVWGRSNSGYGVVGEGAVVGVRGQGTASAPGVDASSTSGDGVRGQSGGNGVFGSSTGLGGGSGGTGVRGFSSATLNGTGVFGVAPSGIGVRAVRVGGSQRDTLQDRRGPPNLRVSWQVTGIRKDPFAEAYRLVPEQPKPPADRGTYLAPELYGQPRTARFRYRPDLEPDSISPAEAPRKSLDPLPALADLPKSPAPQLPVDTETPPPLKVPAPPRFPTR